MELTSLTASVSACDQPALGTNYKACALADFGVAARGACLATRGRSMDMTTAAKNSPARPAARARLEVSIAVISAPLAGSPAVVRVTLTGGVAPVRLYLSVDGDLVEAWMPAASTCEFDAASIPLGRHVVTARAVDALGRWDGASTVLHAPYRVAGPVTPLA